MRSGTTHIITASEALNILIRLKDGKERINNDTSEASIWLDEVTEYSNPTFSENVQLEGVDQVYNTWAEVEAFLLPETLLSMEDSDSDEDYLEDLESSFNAFDVSDETSLSSTNSLEQSPKLRSSIGPLSHSVNKEFTTEIQKHNTKTTAVTLESPNRTARNSTDHPPI